MSLARVQFFLTTVFLTNLVLANSHPPANSPISYDGYQLFQTAAHAVSQGGLTPPTTLRGKRLPGFTEVIASPPAFVDDMPAPDSTEVIVISLPPLNSPEDVCFTLEIAAPRQCPPQALWQPVEFLLKGPGSPLLTTLCFWSCILPSMVSTGCALILTCFVYIHILS